MTVELPTGVRWISECYPHDGSHEHVSVYLIPHEEGHVAVDSGSFYHRSEIKEAIDEETDGDGLDALVLSHSDYPHAGNISAFREEWGDIDLVASSGAPELQGLGEARQCEIGGTTTVLGRRFHFVDPPLADRSHSTWIYDAESGTLFTADGFGAYHRPGECEYLSSDFDEGIDVDDVYEYHRNNLVWLRYVDPQKLRAAITDILERYDVAAIAPVHGHPIVEADIPGYVETLVDAAERISSEYTVSRPN